MALDMDVKIELIHLPVTDVDRAKAFYVDQCGFNADHDVRVSESLRFVQITPPGSACSFAFGEGLGATIEPGALDVIQAVVADADAALAATALLGHRCRGCRRASLGPFRDLRRPRRQQVDPAAIAAPAVSPSHRFTPFGDARANRLRLRVAP